MLPAGTSGGRFRPNYNNTGRERAVDELVDASPEGSFARALSIQPDSISTIFRNRPFILNSKLLAKLANVGLAQPPSLLKDDDAANSGKIHSSSSSTTCRKEQSGEVSDFAAVRNLLCQHYRTVGRRSSLLHQTEESSGSLTPESSNSTIDRFLTSHGKTQQDDNIKPSGRPSARALEGIEEDDSTMNDYVLDVLQESFAMTLSKEDGFDQTRHHAGGEQERRLYLQGLISPLPHLPSGGPDYARKIGNKSLHSSLTEFRPNHKQYLLEQLLARAILAQPVTSQEGLATAGSTDEGSAKADSFGTTASKAQDQQAPQTGDLVGSLLIACLGMGSVLMETSNSSPGEEGESEVSHRAMARVGPLIWYLQNVLMMSSGISVDDGMASQGEARDFDEKFLYSLEEEHAGVDLICDAFVKQLRTIGAHASDLADSAQSATQQVSPKEGLNCKAGDKAVANDPKETKASSVSAEASEHINSVSSLFPGGREPTGAYTSTHGGSGNASENALLDATRTAGRGRAPASDPIPTSEELPPLRSESSSASSSNSSSSTSDGSSFHGDDVAAQAASAELISSYQELYESEDEDDEDDEEDSHSSDEEAHGTTTNAAVSMVLDRGHAVHNNENSPFGVIALSDADDQAMPEDDATPETAQGTFTLQEAVPSREEAILQAALALTLNEDQNNAPPSEAEAGLTATGLLSAGTSVLAALGLPTSSSSETIVAALVGGIADSTNRNSLELSMADTAHQQVDVGVLPQQPSHVTYADVVSSFIAATSEQDFDNTSSHYEASIAATCAGTVSDRSELQSNRSEWGGTEDGEDHQDDDDVALASADEDITLPAGDHTPLHVYEHKVDDTAEAQTQPLVSISQANPILSNSSSPMIDSKNNHNMSESVEVKSTTSDSMIEPNLSQTQPPPYPYCTDFPQLGTAVYDPHNLDCFGLLPLDVLLIEILRAVVIQLTNGESAGSVVDSDITSGERATPSSSSAANISSSTAGLNIRSARLTEALKMRPSNLFGTATKLNSNEIDSKRKASETSTDGNKFRRSPSSSRRYEACLDLLTSVLAIINHLRNISLEKLLKNQVFDTEGALGDKMTQSEVNVLKTKVKRYSTATCLALRCISLSTMRAYYSTSDSSSNSSLSPSLRKLSTVETHRTQHHSHQRHHHIPFVTGRRRRQRQALLEKILLQQFKSLPIGPDTDKTCIARYNALSETILPRTHLSYCLQALESIWPIVTRKHSDRAAYLMQEMIRVVKLLQQHKSDSHGFTTKGLDFPWSELDADTLYINALCGRMMQKDCFASYFIQWTPSSTSTKQSGSISEGTNDECMLIPMLNTIYNMVSVPKARSILMRYLPNVLRLNDFLFHHSNKYFILHSWSPNLLDIDEEYSEKLETALQRWDFFNGCSQMTDTSNLVNLEGHTYFYSPRRSLRDNALRDGPSSGEPTTIEFDSSRCSDSIAILPPISSLGGAASSPASTPASRRSGSGTENEGGPVSVSQRASKVWGCVCATWAIAPSSGIHSWAVHLDKCDRGHVFVGVVTSQASVKTYVGGDAHGWGMIGTKALWHDRSKLRGDYGSTFRTGSTVIVTLDSNVGSLRFGILHDANRTGTVINSTPSFPTTSASLVGSGVYIEDWGVAFEGLPLNVNLYPAVGLYQRDDGVTIKTVSSLIANNSLGTTDSANLDSIGSSARRLSSGSRISTLPYSERSYLLYGQSGGDKLRWENAVLYTTFIIRQFVSELTRNDSDLANFEYAFQILQTLLSSFLLIPSAFPDEQQQLHASRCWIKFIPLLQWTIEQLNYKAHELGSNSMYHSSPLLSEGRWKVTRNANLGLGTQGVISVGCRRNISSAANRKKLVLSRGALAKESVNRPEEYTIDLRKSNGSEQSELPVAIYHGSGSSSFAQRQVFVKGTIHGNRFMFTEEWGATAGRNDSDAPPSVYLCEARVFPSCDGGCDSFVGSCYSAATGKLVYEIDAVLLEKKDLEVNRARQLQNVQELSRLASLAMGNVSSLLLCSIDVLADGIHQDSNAALAETKRPRSSSHVGSISKNNMLFVHGLKIWRTDKESLKNWIENEISLFSEGRIFQKKVGSADNESLQSFLKNWTSSVFKYNIQEETSAVNSDTMSNPVTLKRMDAWAKTNSGAGGNGSLWSLAPTEFDSARLYLIRCILYHTNIGMQAQNDMESGSAPSELVALVWRSALMCMERLVRASLGKPDMGDSIRRRCSMACEICQAKVSLLMQLEPATALENNTELVLQTVIQEVVAFVNSNASNAEWDASLEELRLSSIKAMLKDHIIIRPILAVLSNFSSQESLISEQVWHGLCTILPPMLAVSNTFQYDSTKHASTKSLLTDWDVNYHFLDGLFGCTADILVQLCSTLKYLFVIIGSQLSQLVNQSLTASNLLNVLSPNIPLLLGAWCIPMPTIQDEGWALNPNDVPLLAAARECGLCTTLSLIRKRHRDIAFENTPEFPDEVAGPFIRHLSHESYHAAWVVTQIIIAQSSHLDFEVLPLHSETHHGQTLYEYVMDDFAIQTGASRKRYMDYRVSVGKTCANHYFEMYLKENKINYDSVPEDAVKDRSLTIRNASAKKRLQARTATSAFSLWMNSMWKSETEIKFSDFETPSKPTQTYPFRCVLSVLDVLFTICHSQGSSGHTRPSADTVNQLLREYLLPVFSKGNIDCLPHYIQIRTLRLMRLIFSSTRNVDQFIGEKVVETALLLIADNSKFDVETSQLSVCRESISFLRFLLCLEETRSEPESQRINWIAVVSRLFNQASKSFSDPRSILMSKGILQLLSGQSCSELCLCEGSHVLLSQSNSLQTTLGGVGAKASSTLSSGSSANSSHASAFLKQVIAGFSRHAVDAGIVIGVDHDRGTADVLLVDRNGYTNLLLKGNTVDDILNLPGLNHTLRLNTVAVRAVKAHINEVVLVNEFPLAGNESFVPGLNSLLDFALARQLSSTLTDTPSDYPEILFLSIRALCELLSDKRALKHFISSPGSASRLHDLLNLAAEYLGPNSGLASLSRNEACYSFLHAVFNRLDYSSSVMETLFEPGPWLETFKKEKDRRIASQTSTKTATTDYPVSEQASARSNEADNQGLCKAINNTVSSAEFTATEITAEGTAGRMASDQSNVSESLQRNTDSANIGNDNATIIEGGDEGDERHNEDDEDGVSIELSEEDMHLREAAVAQMAELGLPRSWAHIALRRTATQGSPVNVESAVHFCLERGGVEMERMVATDQERHRERRNRQRARDGNSGANGISGNSLIGGVRRNEATNAVLQQLFEMGFPSQWCSEALAATGNNVDEALSWILANGERLAARESGGEEGAEDDTETEDDMETSPPSTFVKAKDVSIIDVSQDTEHNNQTDPGIELIEHNVVCPLRFVSGQSAIDPKTQVVSGLSTGGFSSVGTHGILLTKGKWYYEATLLTAGCLQIGWADSSFQGHCHAERGDGCGDGPSSWAYDGWRRYKWHGVATEWGARWSVGDVVGCCIDLDSETISFCLNGRAEEIGMGLAFTDIRPVSGVYPCVSFNRKEKIKLCLGGKFGPLTYGPPEGYRAVGEYFDVKIHDYEKYLQFEKDYLKDRVNVPNQLKRYLCNFSDGEHGHELFAWQHRYYGSDASVHLGSSPKVNNSSEIGDSSLGGDEVTSPEMAIQKMFKAVWNKEHHSGCSLDLMSYDANSFTEKSLQIASQGLSNLVQDIGHSIESLSQKLASLMSKKLILFIMVSLNEQFDLSIFCENFTKDLHMGEISAAQNIIEIIESCASLRSTGWVGEAGTMAIAAEALGLGISSSQNGQGASSSSRIWIGLVSKEYGPTFFNSCRVAPGCTLQLTTSEIIKPFSRQNGLVACAESALLHEGSGMLLFMRDALLALLKSSKSSRFVVVAAVRQMVRTLSSVEFTKHEVASDGEESKESSNKNGATSDSSGADARFASFLSGLVLSSRSNVHDESNNADILEYALFEAWSIGCLSGSAPWRMVCAYTSTGILNLFPKSLEWSTSRLHTLQHFYSNLGNAVTRRIWAERAASPVCSQYVQAMIDLWTAVKASGWARGNLLPFVVDSATPKPLPFLSCVDRSEDRTASRSENPSWESLEGLVCSDNEWDIWTGTLHILPVEWHNPTLYSGRTLMDGGEGPPLLKEGDLVMRGVDWDSRQTNQSVDYFEDGKDSYDDERESRKQKLGECDGNDFLSQIPDSNTKEPSSSEKATVGKSSKRISLPKLPVGTVIGIEPWKGIQGRARRVRWHRTGMEGIYRWGGGGGRFDLVHVETNDKETRIRKRHPLPETAEQCAARHGFGSPHKYHVILRLCEQTANVLPVEDGETPQEVECEGILEYPDLGAGTRVTCTYHSDGAVTLLEGELIYGAKDHGWEARFGQASYISGTCIILTPTSQLEDADDSPDSSSFEILLGSDSREVAGLMDKGNGGEPIRITSELHLKRNRRKAVSFKCFTSNNTMPRAPCMLPPIKFDEDYHPTAFSLSRDCSTLTCKSSEGRGTAFANIGFTKGLHYWEVRVEQADIGSVFIGVAEKPRVSGNGGSSPVLGPDGLPRLNRWLGHGFVNFRATYSAGAERVYGAHAHAGDIVGVLLDCDSGRLSFFLDGVKYGEHIMNDLGCAFENLSTFGFNADGCGSGGAGQGAPNAMDRTRDRRYASNGFVQPRSLWPVVGLRSPGDRVSFGTKWISGYGPDGVCSLRNISRVDELLRSYNSLTTPSVSPSQTNFPAWFVAESFREWKRWKSGRWFRTVTRGSGPCNLSSYGLDAELDTSPESCAYACAMLGLQEVFLPGDVVLIKRSFGRILEIPEEALVLGSLFGRLYYKILNQKSEGSSLSEGGGRPWYWDESEVVDGGVSLANEEHAKGLGIPLPLISKFHCPCRGGLRVVYSGGAVVRSDLEIFDGSSSIGVVKYGTVIAREQVLERRVNSCGVVRYKIKHEDVGEGWISARIRGGKEEPIIERVIDGGGEKSLGTSPTEEYEYAEDAAACWIKKFNKIRYKSSNSTTTMSTSLHNVPVYMEDRTFDDFNRLLREGVMGGMNAVDSDSVLATAVSRISDELEGGDPMNVDFAKVAVALDYALSALADKPRQILAVGDEGGRPSVNHAAATVFSTYLPQSKGDLSFFIPSLPAIMARVALLRAFNRRVRFAIPWLSVQPIQEKSSVFGGSEGFGMPWNRFGRLGVTSLSKWIQVPSIGTRIRRFKNLIFTTVKRAFFESLLDSTTTPTQLSHDEYELPREIRTVRVNRLKARRAGGRHAKRKFSVFSQLQHEMRSWSGAALRRGFVAKGHGGQKRAFKVKLIGEGVNDYSGPYREVFTDAIREVCEIGENGRGLLGVLEPSPNQITQVGNNRDLFLFSDGETGGYLHASQFQDEFNDEEQRILLKFSGVIRSGDETSREIEERVAFLGRLTSTAVRHGIPMDLNLPLNLVWKRLTEEIFDENSAVEEVSLLTAKIEDERVKRAHVHALLSAQQRLLNSFVDGMCGVLPVEAFALFTGNEFRDVVCGNSEIDVDLLRRVAKYENYDESKDDVVSHFWTVLREMSNQEKKLFLQFVWARTRLPCRASDFDAPFKIIRDAKASASPKCDEALPSASTCFFSLTLPNYSTKETLREKLLFAIENVCTMESDYVTNDAEVGEGWKGI